MAKDDRWLLPEGIEEVLPDQARRLESLRRQVLDLFDCWGYELVMPPMIEYLESLLTGVGRDLDLQTFKVTDQVSGRMMGIRSDMTPQAARIDAHYLKRDGAVRLCYLGPVLLTLPDQFAGSREPMQMGAECFGHQGPESDVEILSLMITTLTSLGIDNLHIDLGHVGVFRGLAAQAGLTGQQEDALFAVLQRKAGPEIKTMLLDWNINELSRRQLMALVDLNGDASVLQQAQALFCDAPDSVKSALAQLKVVASAVAARLPFIELYYDLAELSGYGYYTGTVFSAFVPGHGRAIAKGGRYDGIGQAFGRARAATGFSADLRELVRLAPMRKQVISGIAAPSDSDPLLWNEIQRLRQQGERVVVQLTSQQENEMCDRELKKKSGKWVVVKHK